MPPKVVLDTNVLVSGLLFGGPPGVLLNLALDGAIHLLISSALLAELERVLMEKFPEAKQATWDTVALLKGISQVTIPAERLWVVRDDPSDDRVLECAISGHADAIVSGDRHLLTLKTFRGIPILSPQEYLTAHSSS